MTDAQYATLKTALDTADIYTDNALKLQSLAKKAARLDKKAGRARAIKDKLDNSVFYFRCRFVAAIIGFILGGIVSPTIADIAISLASAMLTGSAISIVTRQDLVKDTGDIILIRVIITFLHFLTILLAYLIPVAIKKRNGEERLKGLNSRLDETLREINDEIGDPGEAE